MSTLDDHARSGIAAINEKRFEDAVRDFEQALALGPDRPDMNNALGMAYMHRGEVGSALPYLEKAVELARGYPDEEHRDMKVHFLTGLATAYQLGDRIADAQRTLVETTTSYPEQIDAHLQLGQLLLTTCQLEAGLAVYQGLIENPAMDDDGRKAAAALYGAARALLESAEDHPDLFLRAHRDSYVSYFDDVVSNQEGWYAEAARMAASPDGEPKPFIPEGARPYAMIRVDLVNPETGEVAGIYSDTEPMIVQVQGLEPLSQIPVMFPLSGRPFAVWVCSQAPWHWLALTIQLQAPLPADARVEVVDAVIADWYLAGYNGDFGEADQGRFHYVTDPEPIGDRAVAYVVDLGRTRYDAIESLLERLERLHADTPIQRVLFGNGYLPD